MKINHPALYVVIAICGGKENFIGAIKLKINLLRNTSVEDQFDVYFGIIFLITLCTSLLISVTEVNIFDQLIKNLFAPGLSKLGSRFKLC